MKARILLGTTVAACSLATAMLAQSGGAKAKNDAAADVPLFKLDVRRVVVDVVVTDKQGHPVHGLKKSDFIVKEDKKPQTVLTFEYFDGSKSDFTPPKLPPLPANTFINVPRTPERGPLYVLYYDMVNTEPVNQMEFRRQLLKFVDEAPTGVRLAIFVNARRLQLVQGFTTDHELLKQAILYQGEGPHIPKVFIDGSTFGTGDAGGALSNLDFMAHYLAGIPGRKNLIWLASQFPIPAGPTVVGTGQMGGGGAPPSMAVGPQGGPEILDYTDLMWDMIHRTYTAMMKAQVALYPVDLKGVTGAAAMGEEADSMINDSYMNTIAAATGGQAYYSNNRLDEQITKAVDDGASYYSVSYEPNEKNFTSTKGDEQQRTIDVSLKGKKKGDYTLHYREGYYAVPSDEVKADKTTNALQARFAATKAQDTLYANIEHGAPMLHDLLFTAHLAAAGEPRLATAEQMNQLADSPVYFKTRKKNQQVKAPKPVKLQNYAIDYEVIDPYLKALAAHGGRPPVLEFAAAAYDNDGRLLNSILNQGVPSGKKGSKAKTDALFNAVQELQAPAGTAYIRLAVRDTLNDRTGTVEVTLPLKPESDVASRQ
jgi:VWFA-related protein